jgi:hypothetical protein
MVLAWTMAVKMNEDEKLAAKKAAASASASNAA